MVYTNAASNFNLRVSDFGRAAVLPRKPWASARRLIERNLILWFDAPRVLRQGKEFGFFQLAVLAIATVN
ncbi:hypothetical protein [Lignipirellula cremea]|uniref:hypothetical protein n=1 Tax=Lignipirellula cremea TaxID=2528010 RepID=UPI0011A90922|nr:hypothetical protein [Lignipirellula cremea]